MVAGVMEKDRLMRAVSVAAFTGLMVLGAGLAPARALPVCPAVAAAVLAVAQPSLLPVRHHGHRWRYRRGGWSGVAPPYGPAPEMGTSEAPAGGYPPAVSAQQPPAPAQGTPDRGTSAPVSRPSIEWVNPDRARR
jgi:hypothetical protein